MHFLVSRPRNLRSFGLFRLIRYLALFAVFPFFLEAIESIDPNDDIWKGLGVTVAADKLSKEITERKTRIPLFKEIEEWGKTQGVRVWILGGAAAAFAQFVKWHLVFESGDKRFLPDYFEYNIENFLRSKQDIDFVVDGSDAQLE